MAPLAADAVSKSLDFLEKLTKAYDAGRTGGSDATGALHPGLLKHCKAVQLVFTRKAGAVVGYTEGSGFALAKLSTNADGTAAWSAPVFLSAHELSLGVLVGAMDAQAIVLLNSEDALSQLKNKGMVPNLSVDAAAAIAQEGTQVAIGLENLMLKEVHTIAMAQGLMVDLSAVVGAVTVDQEANAAVYGRQVSAKEVLEGNVEPPAEFEPLAAKLNEIILTASQFKQFGGEK